jgi:hypothetical protein
MRDVCHSIQPLVEMGFANFLLRLAWNGNTPDLASQDYRHEPPCPVNLVLSLSLSLSLSLFGGTGV